LPFLSWENEQMLMGHRTTWSRAVFGIRRLGGVNRI
jgi:hypothetical protein